MAILFKDQKVTLPGRRRKFASKEVIKGMVSVIIPSYQSRWCIGDAVESVLAQTYKNIEIIVVDDGSMDDTSEFLEKQFGGKISVVSQTNQGLAGARNTGLEIARGEFVQFLDADDLIFPEKLGKQVEFLIDHPEIDSVISYIAEVDLETGVPLDKAPNICTEDLFPAILWTNCIGPVHGPLTRMSVLERIGGFDEDFHNYCADWELWLSAAWLGYRFALLSEYLGVYRRHSKSLRKVRVLPNAKGNLMVVFRAAQYAEIDDCAQQWQIDAVLAKHHERVAYWATREGNFRTALAHLKSTWDYDPAQAKVSQILNSLKIIGEAVFFRIMDNNPRLLLFAQKTYHWMKD